MTPRGQVGGVAAREGVQTEPNQGLGKWSGFHGRMASEDSWP